MHLSYDTDIIFRGSTWCDETVTYIQRQYFKICFHQWRSASMMKTDAPRHWWWVFETWQFNFFGISLLPVFSDQYIEHCLHWCIGSVKLPFAPISSHGTNPDSGVYKSTNFEALFTYCGVWRLVTRATLRTVLNCFKIPLIFVSVSGSAYFWLKKTRSSMSIY